MALTAFLADRRQEAHEMLPVLALGQPGTKRVPQERERRDLIDRRAGLSSCSKRCASVRMRFQADRCAAKTSRTWRACLLLSALPRHHNKMLERNARELPGHPRIERIVHEYVSQQWESRTPAGVPSSQDIGYACHFGKPAGGDIKVHGLPNDYKGCSG